MITLESSPQRLVLRSGSTAVVLDKDAGKAILQRKLLFWARKPLERPISSVAQARVNTDIDPASKAEMCSTMLALREGGGWCSQPETNRTQRRLPRLSAISLASPREGA